MHINGLKWRKVQNRITRTVHLVAVVRNIRIAVEGISNTREVREIWPLSFTLATI